MTLVRWKEVFEKTLGPTTHNINQSLGRSIVIKLRDEEGAKLDPRKKREKKRVGTMSGFGWGWLQGIDDRRRKTSNDGTMDMNKPRDGGCEIAADGKRRTQKTGTMRDAKSTSGPHRRQRPRGREDGKAGGGCEIGADNKRKRGQGHGAGPET